MPTIQALLQQIEQDKAKIVNFCSQLVQCETPSHIGDTRQAMHLISEFLQAENLPFEQLAYETIMPNLLASQTMAKQGKHLMFNGHLDVMPVSHTQRWKYPPFSGKVAGGKIWGRGTQDMKAGVTAMLFAYAYLSRVADQLGGKLSLSLVSDEETGEGRGTGFLFDVREQAMLADCVLSAEPSGIDAISFSSKGYLTFAIKVQTKGAIAGYSHESKNAISIAAELIQKLQNLRYIPGQLPDFLAQSRQDPDWCKRHYYLRGKGHSEQLAKISVDIGTIHGGDLHAVIADECTFDGSIVMPVGTDVSLLIAQLNNIVAEYPEAALTIYGVDEGEWSDPSHEIVSILQDSVAQLGKPRPEPTPDIALSDCRYWRYRGIPAFWYGVDGSKCSQADEAVKIEELIHLTKSYVLAGWRYLQP